MRFCVIWLEGDCPCNEIIDNVVFSQLVGNHTQFIQGDRLVWIDLQYLLINVLSLMQTTRSVVLYGEDSVMAAIAVNERIAAVRQRCSVAR